MDKPISISQIILAPAERVDVIIDFANHKGQRIILTNDANTPFPNGQEPTEDEKQIMQFRIKPKLSKPDKSKIPERLSCLEQLDHRNAIFTRKNTLVEAKDSFGRMKLLLNNLKWDHPHLTETPYNGTVEIWELYNTTVDTHPIHMHLVNFQILNRAGFTGNPNGPNLKVGPPHHRSQREGSEGYHPCQSGEVTRILVRFGPFTGIYPWHCHILEHEDHDMMRPFEVLDNQNFNPCKSFSRECPDDSLSRVLQCNKTLKN